MAVDLPKMAAEAVERAQDLRDVADLGIGMDAEGWYRQDVADAQRAVLRNMATEMDALAAFSKED